MRKSKQTQQVYFAPKQQHFDAFLDSILSAPHCLIAGTTGSGKSVLLNDVLYNFMINYGVVNRLILIDPKRVELSIYRELPHTMEYTHDSARAVELLQFAIDIIENRFAEMETQRLRQYNGGHVYIIIDEIADLMLSEQSKTIERQLQKITQIGRACNVHLICATQLVRADILTTKITGNIPNKIALRCSNAMESRQIVGVAGAETLPHHGYALYKCPQYTDVVMERVRFIPESATLKTINSWNSTLKIK